MYKLVFISSVLALAAAKSVRFAPCTSPDGKVTNVDVTPCVESIPGVCDLKRGTTPQINVTFTPTGKVSSLKAVVHGVINHISVPFPLPNPDACKAHNLKCPLAPKTSVVYSEALEIKSIYPPVLVVIKWELLDQSGKDVSCFAIRGKITS